MPRRRAPLLALVLALALVAYPATMPFAMAAETPAPMPMSMHGNDQCAHQHPPAHHHALTACCAGVCGSCPVISISAGIAPRIRGAALVVTFRNDLPVADGQLAVRRLPYSIGPPRAPSLA